LGDAVPIVGRAKNSARPGLPLFLCFARAEFFALPTVGAPFDAFDPIAHSPYRRIAVSPYRRVAVSPIRRVALYTPSLSRQINRFMEVDFQAIKLEELKSRLGELRRYL